MATLTADEMGRIKYELNDAVLSYNALPWIGIRVVWDVIQTSVESSSTPATSSSTAITAAGPVTITVASATGLSVGTRVQLDCDGQRETCSVRNVAGNVLSLVARKIHSGTYPVEIESPLTIVRGCVADLSALEQVNSLASFESLGLRRVDEIEWDEKGSGYWVDWARNNLRRSLARALGVEYIFDAARARGANLEVY